jgi:hypothetical protein
MPNSKDDRVRSRIGRRTYIARKGKHGPPIADRAELGVLGVTEHALGSKRRAYDGVFACRVCKATSLFKFNYLVEISWSLETICTYLVGAIVGCAVLGVIVDLGIRNRVLECNLMYDGSAVGRQIGGRPLGPKRIVTRNPFYNEM